MKRNFYLGKSKRVLGIVMAAAIAITGIPFPASQVQASESAITVSGLTGNALTVTDDTNGTISIGNDQLSRTFKIVNGKLTTGTINNKLAGENVVFTPAAGSEEFVIRTLGSEGVRVEPDAPLTSVRPVIESDEEETTAVPVISVSSSMPNDGGGMAAATDKNAGTYWSSDMETANAAYFQVIFAGEKKVTRVDYTPRYDGSAIYNCTGRITGMKFQVYDGTNWTDLTDAEGAVKTFDLGTDNTVAGYPIPVTVDLSDLNVVVHGIRVMASASYHWQEANKNKVINIAEIDIFGVASNAEEGTQPASLIHVETQEEPAEPEEQQDWVLTGNSVKTSDGGGYAAFLENDRVDTWYHSDYVNNDAPEGKWPVQLTLDRGDTVTENTAFQTIGYRPRTGGASQNGQIKSFYLFASDSADGLFAEANKLTFENGTKVGNVSMLGNFSEGNNKPEWVYISLAEPCNARYIGIEVIDSQNGRRFVAGSGLDLFKEQFDSVPVNTVYDGEEIKASELELVKVTNEAHVTNGGKEGNEGEKTGQLLTFEFKPISWGAQGTITIYQKVVMYEGDHYMRKWVEIKFSDDADKLNRIAYIDGEHLYTTPSTEDLNAHKAANAEEGKDVIWTIPANSGGIVAMDEGKADLGQPVYINGLFMGSEFPAAQNKIELANATETTEAGTRLAISRYYTGKNLGDLERDDHFLNQLTDDNKFVAWQTVVGASRSNGKDQSIVQQDFFSYIRDISTPSEFRIQYNSWYDNMMRITDENIMEAFKDIDKNFVKTGVRPLDSYVVDDGWNVYRKTAGTMSSNLDIERNGPVDEVNTAGFWQFNSKFPNELYTSSDYVQKMGSYFGVWIGPRGGYNYQGTLADIIQTGLDTDGDGVKDVQYGSSAGGSIDVADSRYVKKFAEMAVDWTNRFKVNYWKWDGFADEGQYGTFSKGSLETVGYSESNQHMYGGPNGEYHVTDLWEKWIYIMEEVREAAEANNIDNLWISLTCYTHPSAWFLQWANSVWLQCVMDRGESANTVLRDKLNTMLTYRDAVYHNFIVDHEFQFPLSNIYNHDPIFGKEGTGIEADTMDGEQFRNHLFMQSGRGTAFWELYYSDSILNDEKYLINADYLEWAEANYELLKHAIMVGDSPDDETTLTTGNNGNATQQSAYGFANFSETEADGILSMRNPAAEDKTFTVKLDESIGVRFDEEYTMWKEHVYLQNEGQTAATHQVNGVAATNNILHKGDMVSITLKPGEVQIWHLKEGGDTTAPALDKIFFNDANTIQVRASERLDNSNITFTVNGTAVPAENVTKYADLRTFIITLDEAMVDGNAITVATANGTDNAGNPLTGSITAKYYENNRIASVRSIKGIIGTISAADRSVVGDQGFAVSAEVVYGEKGVELLKQGDNYVLGINAEGQPYFTVNGVTATSDMVMAEGQSYKLSGIRENNGYVRLYIDNQINKAAYDKSSVGFKVEAAPITYATGKNTLKNVLINSAALAYDEVPESPLKVFSNVYVVDQDAKSITTNDAKTTAEELLAGLIYQDDVTVTVERKGVELTAATRVADGDIVTVSVAGETGLYTILVEEDGTAKKIPQSSMRATAGSEETSADQNQATNAIDGKTGTIWHTSWTSAPTAENKWITIELTEDYSVSGYEYTPRNGGGNGTITAYEIYTSNTNNGSDWVLAAKGNSAEGNAWAADSTVKTAMFEQPVQAKYVKLLAKEGVGGFASAAEINLFGERVYPSDTEQPSAPVLSVNEVSSKTVELSWTESSDGENGSGVSEYYLKQDGEEIARFGANAREYIVGGLQPETEYSFEVVAVDRAGNEAGSEIIKATTGIKAEVLGYTLSLEGTIGVNFHMQLGDTVLADEDAYMNFTLGGKEYMTIPVESAIIDDKTGLYIFKCEVPVKDMETEIIGQIVLSDGRRSSEFKYTVKDYADKIEDKINKGEVLQGASPEVIQATIELVETMSDFGNYATAYFTEESIEETTAMKAVTAETLEDYQGKFPADSSYYGSSLLLKSDTIIRHYFTEKVTDTAVKKGDLYYIELEGIPAHKLGTEIVTEVGDMEIAYSPLSYAHIALSRDDVDENLRSVMRAMYLYYEAAQAYKNTTTE